MVVVTELKLTLRNSSHLSASSRRPEDVKKLRVAEFLLAFQYDYFNFRNALFYKILSLNWK